MHRLCTVHDFLANVAGAYLHLIMQRRAFEQFARGLQRRFAQLAQVVGHDLRTHEGFGMPKRHIVMDADQSDATGC